MGAEDPLFGMNVDVQDHLPDGRLPLAAIVGNFSQFGHKCRYCFR